jgi:hypothetical protein
MPGQDGGQRESYVLGRLANPRNTGARSAPPGRARWWATSARSRGSSHLTPRIGTRWEKGDVPYEPIRRQRIREASPDPEMDQAAIAEPAALHSYELGDPGGIRWPLGATSTRDRETTSRMTGRPGIGALGGAEL